MPIPAIAFLRSSIRLPVSTTTGWASISRVFSTSATIASSAGMITTRLVERLSAFPFMVSSRDYGLIWDNPSKTTIDLGFNLQNVWSSEVGDRVSFFVIAGDNTDEVYEGYRQLTGVAHMLPKATYGYIQSKAIYPTQDQLHGSCERISRPPPAARCARGGLPEHDEAGRVGSRPGAMARSSRDEQAASFHGHHDAAQCVAAFLSGYAVITTCCGRRAG